MEGMDGGELSTDRTSVRTCAMSMASIRGKHLMFCNLEAIVVYMSGSKKGFAEVRYSAAQLLLCLVLHKAIIGGVLLWCDAFNASLQTDSPISMQNYTLVPLHALCIVDYLSITDMYKNRITSSSFIHRLDDISANAEHKCLDEVTLPKVNNSNDRTD